MQEGHVQRWQGRHAALWGTSANTRQTRTLVTKDYSSKMLKRTIGSRFYAKKKKKKESKNFGNRMCKQHLDVMAKRLNMLPKYPLKLYELGPGGLSYKITQHYTTFNMQVNAKVHSRQLITENTS